MHGLVRGRCRGVPSCQTLETSDRFPIPDSRVAPQIVVMVLAHLNHETVFTVLGEAARQRSPRSLAAQLILSVVTAASILAIVPHWWSVAFLAGCSAAYSAWGLLSRYAETRGLQARSFHALLVIVTGLGTAFAIAGLWGIGLALYTGDAAGAKTTCGPRSTSAYCQASTHPRQATGPLLPK